MHIPRILFSAPSSGTGKTTITCGFLTALKYRNQNVVSFKCGPDYIDTLFHSHVLNVHCYNIDTFLMGEKNALMLFCQNAFEKQIAVMEGVMGYYDGIAGTSIASSTYHIASLTKTPVILVVNGKGMSLSIVALLKGFLEYQKQSAIKGVILNGVSEMHYQTLKKVIEIELPIKVYGYIPQSEEFTLKSRHLGLITPQETEYLQQKMNILAKQMEKTVQIDAILELAQNAEELDFVPKGSNKQKQNCCIAVAKDNAFCFYYEDNIQYLKQNGCNIQYFSPLHDKVLPSNIHGMILGGGYPELYAKELSENTSMIKSIQCEINKGLPVFAECGGFLYLHETLQDIHGKEYAMLGVIKAKAVKGERLKQFGYVTLRAQKNTLLCNKGECIPAHEFHYWQSTNAGNTFEAVKPLSQRKWECIHSVGNVFGGFPHIHFYGNINIADNFIKLCRMQMMKSH